MLEPTKNLPVTQLNTLFARSVSWLLVRCVSSGRNTGIMGDRIARIGWVWSGLGLGLGLVVVRVFVEHDRPALRNKLLTTVQYL